MTSNFIRLTVAVLPYSYGKKGSDSLAARFAAATPENNFKIDENQAYGEIWMGDHPNGPSRTVKDNKTLADLIASNPEEYLTLAVYEKFNKDPHLPFLFKILSFRKALPLQAHPDKSLAKQLMEQEKREKGKNEKFVDPNYKPEVSVTVSDLFEGFIGFRPLREIKLFLEEVPEFREAIGNEDLVEQFLSIEESQEDKVKGLDLDLVGEPPKIVKEQEKKMQELLKTLFWSLFKRAHDDIARLCEALLASLHLRGEEALGTLGKQQNLGPIVKKILFAYPEDVGMFAAVFFTNFVRLKRGEGIAIPADCIHAYLEGDVIECMAWSDNMIACGFGENDDPSIFADMLLYNAGPSKNLELKHHKWEKSTTGKTEFYQTPMPEFDLLNMKFEKDGEEEIIRKGIAGPSIFIVIDGEILLKDTDEGRVEECLKSGQVIFIKPNTGFKVKAIGGGSDVWGAFVEV